MESDLETADTKRAMAGIRIVAHSKADFKRLFAILEGRHPLGGFVARLREVR
jgi:hypothetical protein